MKNIVYSVLFVIWCVVFFTMQVDYAIERRNKPNERREILADKIDSVARVDRHYFGLEKGEEISICFSEIYKQNNLERECFAVYYEGKGHSYSVDDEKMLCYGEYSILSADGKVSIRKNGEELLVRYPDGTVKSSSFIGVTSKSGYYPMLQELN